MKSITNSVYLKIAKGQNRLLLKAYIFGRLSEGFRTVKVWMDNCLCGWLLEEGKRTGLSQSCETLEGQIWDSEPLQYSCYQAPRPFTKQRGQGWLCARFSAKPLWCLPGKANSTSDSPSSSQTGAFCWSARSPVHPSVGLYVSLYFLTLKAYDVTVPGPWGPGFSSSSVTLYHVTSLGLSFHGNSNHTHGAEANSA